MDQKSVKDIFEGYYECHQSMPDAAVVYTVMITRYIYPKKTMVWVWSILSIAVGLIAKAKTLAMAYIPTLPLPIAGVDRALFPGAWKPL